MHAAQGRTTDTSHAVITSWTSLAALYVALSRGRDANTAHIATTSTIEDPAQGRPDQTVHRDPIALLAGILDRDDPLGRSSTLAIAAASADQTANVQTPAELLADAAALAAAERTARWLDQLADGGYLTRGQRGKLAAEDGAASLGRMLRRVELAGLDPRQVLVEAVADRSLDGATNATSVIVARITDHNTRRFDPIGASWAEWLPAHRQSRVGHLPRRARRRRGRAHRPARPRGRRGSRPRGRSRHSARSRTRRRGPGRMGTTRRDRRWLPRAARAHRQHRRRSAVRPPPDRQTETYAAYRAAWDALGRPQVQQAEHEMSNGQHRVRIRAWQRERAIAPRYVGNELAGTRQAAAHHHQTATLRAAEADQVTDAAERARLRQEATDARALAQTPRPRVTELEALDTAYARHRLHTTVTRVNAEISEQILAERHAPLDDPEDLITGDDWLAAHRAALDDEDQHRLISEDDITDDTPRSRVELEVEDIVEPDLREIAAAEPRQTREDETRVPAAGEVLDATERARRTIHELNTRDAYDQQAEEEERAAQRARWHDDDQADHTAALDEATTALGREQGDYQPAN